LGDGYSSFLRLRTKLEYREKGMRGGIGDKYIILGLGVDPFRSASVSGSRMQRWMTSVIGILI